MGIIKKLARASIPRSVRGWLRSPLDAVRWISCDLQASCGYTSKLEPRSGWTIRSHPGAYHSAYYAQQTDAEQVAEFDQFISHCSSGMVLYDIGAHFGLFSLAATHFGGATARAIAVDPSPLAERVIRFQARINNVGERVRVIRAAAGAASGTQSFVSAGIGSAGYFVRPAGDHPVSEQVEVATVSVDQLVAESGWMPTHVKVDVEGFELGVLQGAVETFQKPDAPQLFLELHSKFIRDAGGSPQDCLKIIRGWGMDVFDVLGHNVSDADILELPLTRIMAVKALGMS